MPKPVRDPEDIEIVRERILEIASDIILEHGFDYFSMRKLAAKLGMTAANIYNYYSNKDELYLAIQTKGFALLYDRFDEACKAGDTAVEKLAKMIKAYLDFGIRSSNYYDIMFNRNIPKYADYVGTDIEPVAFIEKQTALKAFDISTQVIEDSTGIPEEDARFRTIQVWAVLHGIVSLYNTRVLQEVEEHTDEIIKRIIDELISSVTSL